MEVDRPGPALRDQSTASSRSTESAAVISAASIDAKSGRRSLSRRAQLGPRGSSMSYSGLDRATGTTLNVALSQGSWRPLVLRSVQDFVHIPGFYTSRAAQSARAGAGAGSYPGIARGRPAAFEGPSRRANLDCSQGSCRDFGRKLRRGQSRAARAASVAPVQRVELARSSGGRASGPIRADVRIRRSGVIAHRPESSRSSARGGRRPARRPGAPSRCDETPPGRALDSCRQAPRPSRRTRSPGRPR